MTYAEAIDYLYGLQMFGAKFGLENTFRLAALAGAPQEKLRFIHVAGTNGKGSTCAMLESIYRADGLRIGLFTSPHLVSFAERIQVNRQVANEREIARLVDEMHVLLKEFSAEAHPTFFEVVTVMALKYFAEKKCDLVIWETGMGGRLDATNIVTPLASVITNVQFEHQKWLGNSLAEIAREKAGIIKPRVPVVTAATEPDAVEIISKTARTAKSPLIKVSQVDTRKSPLDKIKLSLIGEHQRWNAALAIATTGVLQKQIPVSDEAISNGLGQVEWPGRLQQIQTSSGQTVLLDGAHNPAGAMALRDALRDGWLDRNLTFIIGILQDKKWETICEILAPLAKKIIFVPVSSERSATPAELARALCKKNPAVEVTALESLRAALDFSARDSLLVITGSLYLVGEALEILQPVIRATNERGLNEWSAPAKK